ncbi:MAG: hypothetical protein DRI98_14980 [Bacteroidetes bacterium]|nr:MAG: hypothetical protein DRI98_14980 [Bacteroidota bacterium]
MIEQTDKRGIYIEHEGVKYRLWPKRGFYVSQVGGKQAMLHRVLYWNGNKATEIIPADGEPRNLNPDNWISRPRNGGRSCSKADYQSFGELRFYANETGYWQSKVHGFLHRYVWPTSYGKIPAGHVIHHKDHDRSNNRLCNLELMTASDHSKHHAKDNKWMGSAANIEQLKAAQLKRWS